MRKNTLNISIYFAVCIFVLIFGFTGVYRLILKSDLPFGVNIGENFVITNNNDTNLNGKKLISVSGIPVSNSFEIEFITDSYSIGDSLNCKFLHNNNESNYFIKLIPYYSNYIFIIISCIIGLLFIITGLFAVFKKPTDIAAVIVFIIFTSFGLTVMNSPAPVFSTNDFVGIANRFLHVIGYITGIISFFHFCTIFPESKNISKAKIIPVYISGFIFIMYICSIIYTALKTNSIDYINQYYTLWNIVQILFLISIISGVVVLLIRYKKYKSEDYRKKIEWIFWGLGIGASPFLVFWVIPVISGYSPLANEEILLSFLILIPFSFAVAVVKYNLFNIEIIVKRSAVYFLLTSILIIAFLVIAGIGDYLFHEVSGGQNTLVLIITAIIISITINPIKNQIQKLVDRTFYKEKYDIEKDVTDFTSKIEECRSISEISSKFNDFVFQYIPVDKYILLIKELHSEDYYIPAYKNIILSKSDLTNTNSISKNNIKEIIPLKPEHNKIAGYIGLGEKVSKLLFSERDKLLLRKISVQLAINIYRLQLQEDLILKELERDKLKELNEMKSYFISSVSHELKTPLTSIKMFTESLLDNKNIQEDKRNSYLGIILGESERLQRLISNILDFAKIEKGMMRYNPKMINITTTLKVIIDAVEYLFKKNEIKLKYSLPKESLIIFADEDAVKSAIINLLSNAIKFSKSGSEVKIDLSLENNFVKIQIIDKGKGIPENDIKSILNKYYRVDLKVEGSGLGLAIVKHIMDSHNGEIIIKSKVNEGSTFILKFPKGEI